MGGCDDVELAVRRPAGEAGTEPLVGLDREDALEDPGGERRDSLILLAELALGRLQPAGELLIREPELLQPPLELAHVGPEQVDTHTLLADGRDREERDPERRDDGQARDHQRQRDRPAATVLVVRHTTNLGGPAGPAVPRTRDALVGRDAVGLGERPRDPGATPVADLALAAVGAAVAARSSPSRRSMITVTFGLSL